MKTPWLGISAAAVVVAIVGSGLYTVRPAEVAIITRLGSPLSPPRRSGLHWRWPFIDRVLRLEVTRTYTLPIGFRPTDRAGDAGTQSDESGWLTGDTNSLSVQLTLQYQIVDPRAFLLGSADPASAVRRGTEAAVTASLGSLPVDDILTTGRVIFLDQVRRRTQAFLLESGAGIQIVSVSLRSIEPPEAVRAAFKDVQNARSDRERFINEATGYANETLPRSRAEANAVLQKAASDRVRRVESALGDTHRFAALAREGARNPSLLRERVYLETMQRILPRTRLVIVDGKGEDTRIHLFDSAPALPVPEGIR